MDGLPVKDTWIDDVQNLITELKHTEKEKVNYMTYQMKIAEVRAEAMAEGEARGEDKLSRLIAHLIEIGKKTKYCQSHKVQSSGISFMKNTALCNKALPFHRLTPPPRRGLLFSYSPDMPVIQ